MALTEVKQAGLDDEAVNESKLQISNAGTNGQYLQKQSGSTGGLTWADVPAGVGGANAVTFNDSVAANFGTDGDQAIWHTGSVGYIRNSTGGLVIRNDAFSIKDDGESETMLTATKDDSVDLYFNNLKQLETTNDGITVTNSNTNVTGAQILLKNYNNTVGYLYGSGTSTPDFGLLDSQGHWGVKVTKDSDVKLYYDNGLKVQTTSYGLGVTGTCFATSDFQLDDGCAYKAGTGDDLQIYHNGTDSYLKNTTGKLRILSDDLRLENAAGDETLAKFANGGACELRYNDGAVFQTAEYGVIIKRPSGGETTLEVIGPEGQDSTVYMAADDGDDVADKWKMTANAGASDWRLYNAASGNWETSIKAIGNGGIELYNANTKKFSTISAGAKVEDDLLVGTGTFGGYGFTVSPDHSAGTAYAVWNRAATAVTAYAASFQNNGTEVGKIQHDDTTTTFGTSSDYRLKENQVPISDGITRLKTLKPYRFNFKCKPSKTVDGFFAHEVTAVPEAFTGTKDEVDSDGKPIYQAIDQSKLVPLLTAALQEAITKIETLETKVAALEAA